MPSLLHAHASLTSVVNLTAEFGFSAEFHESAAYFCRHSSRACASTYKEEIQDNVDQITSGDRLINFRSCVLGRRTLFRGSG
jgi:hypothetical protein